MANGIGISITERISAAVVVDHAVTGKTVQHPDDGSETDSLHGVPAELIIQQIAELIKGLELKDRPTHVGVGIPGIVRNGVVEDSPNLVQFKGLNVQSLLQEAIAPVLPNVPVLLLNDAHAMAAGMAASRGLLDRLIRLWFLGTGIGFGRYPLSDGFWEAGHCDSGSERNFLRLRRQGALGRDHGAACDAFALHGSGAGRSLRAS